MGCFRFPRPHNNYQVFRCGCLNFRCQQPALGQQLFVGGGTHHHTRVVHAGQISQGTLQLHQDN
jgi:hypothetical protein